MRRGEELDRLAEPRDAQFFFDHMSRWYGEHTTSGWTPPAARLRAADLPELRVLRDAVRALASGDLPRHRRLTARLLERHHFRLAVDGTVRPVERGWSGAVASLLPVLIALSGRPERVRFCANPRCRWIIVDRSRSGRRRWCVMRACGNRMKVRRFRQRHRSDARSASHRARRSP